MDNSDNRDSGNAGSSTTRSLYFNSIKVVGISIPAGTHASNRIVGDIVGVRITKNHSESIIDKAEILHSDKMAIASITLGNGAKIDLTCFLLSNYIPSNYNNSSNLESVIIDHRGTHLKVTTINDLMGSDERTHSFTLKEILEFEDWAKETRIDDAEILHANGKVIPSLTLRNGTKIDLTDFLQSRSLPDLNNISNLKDMIIGRRGLELRISTINAQTYSFTLKDIDDFNSAAKVQNMSKKKI